MDKAESLDCRDCSESDAESDVFCIPCNLYLCCKHFEERHPTEGEGDAQTESSLSAHEFRILLGVSRYKIDAMPVGWITGESQSQFAKDKANRELKKRKSEDELRDLDQKVETAAVAALLNPKAELWELYDYIDDAPLESQQASTVTGQQPSKKPKRQIDPVTGLMSLRPI